MSLPRFETIRAGHVDVLASEFAQTGSRRISAVHLHHTYIPDGALFRSLSRRLGGDRAAGLELCRRMWRVHTETNGWSDIAQHVTIDPAGAIWLCRSWHHPPASAAGFNGNRSIGPFMIELVGNFDAGQEEPTPAQHAAAVATIGAIQRAFGLPSDALAFHSELNAGKSCPGNSMDKSALVAALEQHRKKASARGRSTNADPFPPERGTDPYAARGGARFGTSRGRGDGWSEREGDAEIDEHRLPFEARSLLTATPGHDGAANRGARGGARGALTPAMARALAPYVVNLRQGRFSNDGDFRTTREDVKRLVERDLARWVKARAADGKPARVMIHAHGGLNDEGHALAYAYRLHGWWLEQGVYPIYFVWETGAGESLLQVLEEYRRGAPGSRGRPERGRGIFSDLWDRAVEGFVNRLATDPWTIMKISAERASEKASEAGASYLAGRLERLRAKLLADDVEIEFHAVGHSAGAIFHAHFLRACNRGDNQVAFRTLSLLAPACTVALFDELLRPRVEHGQVGHLNLFCLDRERERSDDSVPAYSKSLLHLVSKGFERPSGTPILGMQEAIERDERLSTWLGLGARDEPSISVVYAPTDAAADRLHRCTARRHGDFSTDEATLRSLALRIGGPDLDPATVPPLPTSGSRDIEPPLFTPLADKLDPVLYDTLFGAGAEGIATGTASGFGSACRPTEGASGAAPYRYPPDDEASAVPAADGRLRALCIGIDAYPGHLALKGCVNDARSWAEALEQRGFDTRVLAQEEATHAKLLKTIEAFVRDTETGDVVVIQYAGHGIQFDDKDGDEIDGKDEAIVPIDSDGRLFVADDELWDVLEAGPDDAWIYVFMDCCHSLTNSRAMPFRPDHRARLMVPETGWREAHRRRLAARGLPPVPVSRSNAEQRHYKYAACEDKQLAYEANGHGKFTLAALAALAEGASIVRNVDFIERALAHFEHGANQTPGIDCRPEWRTRPFLGGRFVR